MMHSSEIIRLSQPVLLLCDMHNTPLNLLSVSSVISSHIFSVVVHEFCEKCIEARLETNKTNIASLWNPVLGPEDEGFVKYIAVVDGPWAAACSRTGCLHCQASKWHALLSKTRK